jgi:hypothetical protein
MCRDEGAGIGLARGWHVTLAARSGAGKSILGGNIVLRIPRIVVTEDIEVASDAVAPWTWRLRAAWAKISTKSARAS